MMGANDIDWADIDSEDSDAEKAMQSIRAAARDLAQAWVKLMMLPGSADAPRIDELGDRIRAIRADMDDLEKEVLELERRES